MLNWKNIYQISQAAIFFSSHYITTRKIINYTKNCFERFTNKTNLKSLPQFISIETSSICNLHCPECMIGNRKTIRNVSFFNLELYKKIIDECKDTLFNVQLFFQGEPFTNKNIYDYINYAYINRVSTIISTNAMLLDDKVAQQIIDSKLTKLIVSIDGTNQKSYEKYRVGGELSTVNDNVSNLVKRKKERKSVFPIIETQMIVFKHNENEVNKFIELSKSLNADIISIKTAQIENPNDNSDIIPTKEKYSRYVYNNRVGEWQIKKRLNKKCSRVFKGLVINSDGNVVPCCYDKIPNHIVGNAYKQDIKSIFSGSKFINFRKQVLKNKSVFDICNNCFY